MSVKQTQYIEIPSGRLPGRFDGSRRRDILKAAAVALAMPLATAISFDAIAQEKPMAATYETAATQYVVAGGVRFAYRRFGRESGVPLVFIQNYRYTLDDVDPLVLDGFAKDRPVILFDNRGVSSSSGETPNTVEAMADDTAAFISGLQLSEVDVLGSSIGGYTAISFVLRHPQLVRRLMLVGTAPRGQVPRTDPRVDQVGGRAVTGLEGFLFLGFAPSDASQAAGRASWDRRMVGQEQRRAHGLDVDPMTSSQTQKAQYAAIIDWRKIKGERFGELKTIKQPTLIVNGSKDIMVPTVNSWIMSQHIPNAQLIVYPDAGHVAHFQYPELFLQHSRIFLDS